MTAANEPVHKDEHAQRPVASVWRPTLHRIVEALARKDYSLTASQIACVRPMSGEKAAQIEKYLIAYGETLTELPEEAWESSVCQWMGTHWDVLVDLFTKESGQSDLVLSVCIFEDAGRYRYEVSSVHVP